MANPTTRIAYLTQVPGPYREQMHEILAKQDEIEYSVIYCALLEPNRSWKLELGKYNRYFLSEKAKSFRHNNINVWKLLNKLKPQVLIITAFKPTMLYGYLWCILRGAKLVVYNDGTLESERGYSKIQKIIRKIVFRKAEAFLAPGQGTVDLYNSYQIPDKTIFKSCLCVDNSRFSATKMESRKYHLMFSGQIIERKMPLFFVEVAAKLKKTIPNLKVLVIGDGNMRAAMINALDAQNIDYDFKGFLDQASLPMQYATAKLFLFPTLNDPWGIVVNEACASGTPVLTCPAAGAAHDLVLDHQNGFVLPLDADAWANHALLLLQNEVLWEAFSEKAISTVKDFNHQQSADGIIDSIIYALV